LAFTVRRIASQPELRELVTAIEVLLAALAKVDDAAIQLVFLRQINEALKGRRQMPMVSGWQGMFTALSESKNAEVRAQALTLAVTFGDPRAFAHMRDLLVNAGAAPALRQSALEALLSAKDDQLPPVLHRLLAEPSLRGPALPGLALYDHANTPQEILSVYGSLTTQEKRDALSTLAARPAYAKPLLDAVAGKKIAAADVSADIVRQLRNLKNKQLDARIAEVWGVVRDTPADRAKLMAHYKRLLSQPAKSPADLPLGRALFAKTCAQCHTLYGIGGKVGPDITGSNRANLDYLLENIIDPSALIQKEYAATVIEMKDGRVVTGIVRAETPEAVSVLTANETLVLPRKEIDTLKPSNTSMMPDDAVQQLKEHELRALIAYLQSPSQVPMLATSDNAKDAFNGKDLTGWDGDANLWRVENGEIVGKSPGLKRNEFLRSHLLAGDFRLTLKVKLIPDTGNSGIQFRSEPLPGGEMRGPQADIGAGWWGKLYDEHGRGLIWDKSGEPYVKKEGWNDYEIVATGSKIRTYINGKLCVDLDDPAGPRRGIFALQLHAGRPMEVRFRDLRLEVR
jgi:putative heme-binding domain-containing protein